MNIKNYLIQSGMTEKQAEIFLTLYRLWPQPASVVARHIDQERTITYKSLLTMTKHGFLSKTNKKNVLHFFVNNIENFRSKILKQKEEANKLAEDLPNFVEQLEKLQNQNFWLKPSTTLYDGSEWLKNLQEDIIDEINTHHYRVIKRFGSHLFDTNSRSTKTLWDYMPKLFNKLEKEKISTDILLGKWISLIENLFVTNKKQEILGLPTWVNSINIIVVWQSIYIIIFEPVPSAIKINHPLLANTFHFFFEKLQTKSQ
jgi:hypothetical protein